MIAKNQHNTKQVCYNPSYVIHGEKWRAQKVQYVGELYIEGDEVHLKCSPAKYVAMNTSQRPFGQKYMRFDVIDEHGYHANTRAYWIQNEQ